MNTTIEILALIREQLEQEAMSIKMDASRTEHQPSKDYAEGMEVVLKRLTPYLQDLERTALSA
jgi:hypothetical protein